MSDPLSEKFVFIYNDNICLYYPNSNTFKSARLSIPPEYQLSYSHQETIIGHHYNKIVLVCRADNYKQTDHYFVLKLDINLKPIGRYYIITHKRIQPINILESEMAICSHLQESKYFHYNGEKDLPYDLEIHKESYRHHINYTINKFCHDKYDDTLVLVLGEPFHHIMTYHDVTEIEVWKKGRKWYAVHDDCVMYDMIKHQLPKNQYVDHINIHHLECSFNYILMIIGVRAGPYYSNYAFILDKETMSYKTHFFAKQIAFCDDREYVIDCILAIMDKGIRITKPVLKIILSYIV